MIQLLKKIFKRKLIAMLVLLASSAFLFILTSCSYDMSSITFADKTVTYDGEAHSIEISGTLPDEVSVTYSGNSQTEVGVYTVTASFTGDSTKYDSIASLTATLTIKEADMADISFESETYTYDGEYHTLEVSGITDTERYTVSYSNNSQKNAGVYSAIAIVTDTEGTYETEYLTATLTIEQATTYDISFADTYVVYDGEAHSITATNMPTGVTASYTGNDQTEIGEYTVTATFTDSLGNYELADMTATLYIQESVLSSLTFADATYTYDGEYHSIEVSGITDTTRFTVSYTNNSQKSAGVYNALAIVTDSEAVYEDVYLTATLTIEQATTYDISFTDLYAIEDGETHSITATNLPTGVTATYTGNEQTEAGTYTVTASFTDELGNYDLADMTATLYIQDSAVSSMTFKDYTVTYDGEGYTITVSNLPDNVTATYTYDGIEVDMDSFDGETEAGTYEVVVSFAVVDDKYTIENMYATLTIEQADLSDLVEYGDIYVALDTDPVSMDYSVVSGVTLASTISVTYTYPDDQDSISAIGNYEVEATFTDSAGNYTDYTATATMKVVSVTDTIASEYECEVTGDFTAEITAYTSGSTSYSIPEYCIIGTKAYEITELDAGLFESNTTVTSITIPDSVTTIGESCFSGCTALATVVMPDNDDFTVIPDNCFKADVLLKNFTTGDSGTFDASNLTSIGTYAFYNCELISDFDLSGNTVLETLGSYSFYACDGLTEFTIPTSENLTTIGSCAFYDCNGLAGITIPSNIITIEDTAFYSCASFTSLDFDDNSNLETIEGSAFTYNPITELNVPSSVTTIGSYAFCRCSLLSTSLNSVTLNEGLVTIGSYAFDCNSTSDANGFTSLSIPSTVTSIGDYCFRYNTSLKTLTFEGNGTSVGNYAFYYDNTMTSIITYDSGSTADVTIGNYAFTSNTTSTTSVFDLTTVVLSDNIISFGYRAFYYDYYLTTITTTSKREDTIESTDTNYMPENLEYVGQEAFYQCTNLDGDMYFYDSLQLVDEAAFYWIMGLDTLYFGGGLASSKATTTLAYRSFYNSNNITEMYLYGVSNIYYQSFYSIEELTSVYFNVQFQTRGYQVFTSCSSLASLYFYDYNGNTTTLTFIGKTSSGNTNLGTLTVSYLKSDDYYSITRN